MQEDETQPELPMESEIESLRSRAVLMGIKHHPNMGVDKLRALVNGKLEGEDAPTEDEELADEVPDLPEQTATTEGTDSEHVARPETKKEAIARQKQESAIKVRKAKALVRIRLVCMDPAKNDWNGEIFTIQNRTVGTIRKYVPFNAPNGWHVPHMMYEMLKNKKCQVFRTVQNSAGHKVRQGHMVPAFSIEVLPYLDKADMERIAIRQAAQETMAD